MEIPPFVPVEKRGLLADVAGELSRVSGVRAVVLGGSYARGTHHAASDLDIGIYYFEGAPFEIEAIRGVGEMELLWKDVVNHGGGEYRSRYMIRE